MADVSRISGPTGPKEPNKDKRLADEQKFKELMKVQKVGEVDEEQKKKRKRKDESEAESKADTDEAAAAQARAKPPLEGPPQKSLKVDGPSAPAKATPPPSPPAQTPPPEETHYMEEESFMDTLPPADLSTQRGQGEQTTQQSPAQPAEHKPTPRDKKAEGAREKALSSAKEADLRAAELKKKRAEEEATEVSQPSPTPLQQEGKKGEKEKKSAEVHGVPGMQPGVAAPLTGTPSAPTAPAPYTQLHPMVLDLFERMVGVMTVMSTAGITETTVTLSSPQYANSVFFGAQIIIKEYSTAPKAFNIQIITNAQGAALVQANADDLMAAFRTGNYNFKVNRLEAGLSAEKPLVRRKEGPSKDKEEKK